MTVDIRSFHISPEPNGAAEVELAVRIIAADGRILGARNFQARAAAASLDSAVAANALSAAFERVATDIVLWTFSTI